jgi:hypothetical protein
MPYRLEHDGNRFEILFEMPRSRDEGVLCLQIHEPLDSPQEFQL